jgi:hypothetical protein
LYYGGAGKWVSQDKAALEFCSLREAMKAYWGEGLRQIEVVLGRHGRLRGAAAPPG